MSEAQGDLSQYGIFHTGLVFQESIISADFTSHNLLITAFIAQYLETFHSKKHVLS